ncbi:hypothetical protein B0H11DRAFT_2257574 [Mycena galericulata]|nr:hypothetical protein B0H11DRAFT_2257574 [Mycena galericulata]
MSDISFSTVRAESVQFGTIFKYRDRLRDLSLLPGELEAFLWAPAESWPEFLEKRLRPMIYYLHAAVTHDFTLVGPKGHYFSGEKTEILEWLEEVLLHCRLVLLSLFLVVGTDRISDGKVTSADGSAPALRNGPPFFRVGIRPASRGLVGKQTM